jgi:hypothetical protein
MAIRIDPALLHLPERVQDHIRDAAASNRRNPYSEVALPLNETLLNRAEKIRLLEAQNGRLADEVASLRKVNEQLREDVDKALQRAFELGKSYWHQADSESIAQNKKADATFEKFKELKQTISAAMKGTT